MMAGLWRGFLGLEMSLGIQPKTPSKEIHQSVKAYVVNGLNLFSKQISLGCIF